MSDLREALTRLADALDAAVAINPKAPLSAWTDLSDAQEAAREALAIEPEYEYCVTAEWKSTGEKHTYHRAPSLDDARTHLPRVEREFPLASVAVERRVKPGPWERVAG